MKKLNTTDYIVLIAVILIGLSLIIFRKRIFKKRVQLTGDVSDPFTIPGTATPPIVPNNLNFEKRLAKGSSGAEVEALQTLLIEDGENLGTFGKFGNGIDGQFGSKTEAALKNQKGVTAITLNEYIND